MLDVIDLSVRFGVRFAVQNVRFCVRPGQWLMLIGPNGAGKSTILNAISQNVAYTGRIDLCGTDIRTQRPRTVARRVGMLAQNHSVSYGFTVGELVRLGRYAYAGSPFSGRASDDAEHVQSALAATGMCAFAETSLLNLSGGELQRAFLAQVFAQNPQLLLLDEPSNHLDPVYQQQVFERIRTWLKTPGRAVVSVVHDLSLARLYGTNALLLSNGRTTAYGTIAEVFRSDTLQSAYGVDVSGWMRRLFSAWRADEDGAWDSKI